MAKVPSGINIIIEGLARVRTTLVTRTGTSHAGADRPDARIFERTIDVDAHIRRIQELIEKALSLATGLSEDLRGVVMNIDDPLRLAYVLASLIEMKPSDRQAMLEANDLLKKLEVVSAALTREVSLLEVKGKIESAAQQEMTDAQRQYYLRQQLKAIQQELGEGEGNELAELRKRIEDAKLPEGVNTVAMREVDRLARMTAASPEYQMLRTYVDWLLDVPWSVTTEDRIDPVEARRVLDEDHYDLDKVKDRIVEYLSVRKLKGDMKGPILCFVGPPGVGKTSLGQSIARAMSRKFVRLSLGGVRDEAEIRGHRRTYIGSIPGRIVQALKQAGSMNPVFMLDEIDKVTVGRFLGRPCRRASRSARPGAESLVPRPLPRDPGRPLARAVHRNRQPARDGSPGAARPDGNHPARRLQRGREGSHRAQVSAAEADERTRAAGRHACRSPDDRCGW